MQDLLEGWAAEVAACMEHFHGRNKPMTMTELARRSGVSLSTISRFLNGKLEPNHESKWKIAGALGERMDVLFAWPRIVPPAPHEPEAA